MRRLAPRRDDRLRRAGEPRVFSVEDRSGFGVDLPAREQEGEGGPAGLRVPVAPVEVVDERVRAQEEVPVDLVADFAGEEEEGEGGGGRRGLGVFVAV